MTTLAAHASYTLRGIEKILGLGRDAVQRLIDLGFVAPARGPRQEYLFSFQDVVLLRAAQDLRAANIPARKMLKSLRLLKARLPAELPFNGLRIKAIGNDVAVREAGAQWQAPTGQLLLDLEVLPSAEGTVSFAQFAKPGNGTGTATGEGDDNSPGDDSAAQWFARGEQLEAADPGRAEHAYHKALALAPDHAHAYVNLGAMLCDGGRCNEAATLYEQAVAHCPDSALVHFNRAIALEDLQRNADALASYERCLQLEPEFADAHYNAARLYHAVGQQQGAIRHFNAYRRLQARVAEPLADR